MKWSTPSDVAVSSLMARLVAVVRTRVSPADVGRLLGVPGPHRAVSAADVALEPLPAGTVLVRGTGRGTLAWSALDEEVPGTEVIGRRQVPAEPTGLHAAGTAASALPEPE